MEIDPTKLDQLAMFNPAPLERALGSGLWSKADWSVGPGGEVSQMGGQTVPEMGMAAAVNGGQPAPAAPKPDMSKFMNIGAQMPALAGKPQGMVRAPAPVAPQVPRAQMPMPQVPDAGPMPSLAELLKRRTR